MRKFWKEIASDISGATAIEYGLIVALIFLAMVSAARAFGVQAITMWSHVAQKTAEATS